MEGQSPATTQGDQSRGPGGHRPSTLIRTAIHVANQIEEIIESNQPPPSGAQSAQDIDPNSHLSELCYDIVALIFKRLPLGSATCFGLTCHKFYDYLKQFHPEPIELTSPMLNKLKWRTSDFSVCNHLRLNHSWICSRSDSCNLSCRLRDWIGTDYNLERVGSMPWDHEVFVYKAMYSAVIDQWDSESGPPVLITNASLLVERYRDWKKSVSFTDPGNDMIQRPLGQFCPHLAVSLPPPFGIGEDWYGLAYKVIQKDMQDSIRPARQARFWRTFSIYSQKKDVIEEIIDEDENERSLRMDHALEDIRFLGL